MEFVEFVEFPIEAPGQLPEPGQIGIGAANYHHCLCVNCPICHTLHVVDIVGSTHPNPRWTFDRDTMTCSPSYKLTHHTGAVCHWNITNGEWVIHGDSTAKPGEGGTPAACGKSEPHKAHNDFEKRVWCRGVENA